MGYEKSDVNVLKVLVAAGVPAVILVASLFALHSMFLAFTDWENNDKNTVESTLRSELEASAHAKIGEYKLLDKEKDVYSIPVSQAMKLIAQENLRTGSR